MRSIGILYPEEERVGDDPGSWLGACVNDALHGMGILETFFNEKIKMFDVTKFLRAKYSI